MEQDCQTNMTDVRHQITMFVADVKVWMWFDAGEWVQSNNLFGEWRPI